MKRALGLLRHQIYFLFSYFTDLYNEQPGKPMIKELTCKFDPSIQSYEVSHPDFVWFLLLSLAIPGPGLI